MNSIFVKLIGDHLRRSIFFSRFSPLVSNLLAALYTVDLIPIDKFPRHDSCRDMTHVEVFFFIFLFHRWRAEVTPSDLG